jgi:hypothetical protein
MPACPTDSAYCLGQRTIAPDRAFFGTADELTNRHPMPAGTGAASHRRWEVEEEKPTVWPFAQPTWDDCRSSAALQQNLLIRHETKTQPVQWAESSGVRHSNGLSPIDVKKGVGCGFGNRQRSFIIHCADGAVTPVKST